VGVWWLDGEIVGAVPCACPKWRKYNLELGIAGGF